MRWAAMLSAVAALGLGAASEVIDAGAASKVERSNGAVLSGVAPVVSQSALSRSEGARALTAAPGSGESEPRTLGERLWRWTFRLGRDPIAVLTLLLFVIGGLQLEISRRTARRQLRAYVSNTPRAVFFFEVGKCPQVRSDIRNHGQTPAFDVGHTFEVAVFLVTPGQTPVLPAPTRVIDTSTTLFPGDMWTWFTGANPLTQGDIDAMRRGEACLYLWGDTSYRDAFQRKRSTHFCVYVTGEHFVQQMERHTLGLPSADFNWSYGPNHGQAT